MELRDKIKEFDYEVKSPYVPEDEQGLVELEKKCGIGLPETYKELIRQTGFIFITSPVMVKSARPLEGVSNEEGLVSLGRFLDWSTGEYSIRKTLNDYADQIPNGFIPFAEGESGDLIGFKQNEQGQTSVFYWYHEAPVGHTLHLMADSFEAFIHSIVKHEQTFSKDEMDKVKKVSRSPKMIELLKKTGKWKGN